jgi:putrescine transport system substrate-binding protein
MCGLTLACAALLAAPGRTLAEEKVLNVYNWSDYIADDTIRNFEKETGIKVRYDNFDNNEILHAKLVAGRTGYDVVVPSSYFGKMQISGGLLRPLDKAALPNWKNLDPVILESLAPMDPGNQHLVPWLWGYTTLGINVAKVKQALGALPMPEDAWDLVFKPEYASKLKSCGISFLDSATEVVPWPPSTWGSAPTPRIRTATPAPSSCWPASARTSPSSAPRATSTISPTARSAWPWASPAT